MLIQQNDSGPRPARIMPRPTPLAPGRLSLAGFAQRAAVVLLLTVIFLLVAGVLWLGIRVVLETFAGLLFGVLLTTLTAWVSKGTKLSHGWSLAVVTLALLALLGGLGFLLANRLMAESAALTQQIPQSLQQVRATVQESPWGKYLLEHAPAAVSQAAPDTFVRATGLVRDLADFLIAALVIVVVGFFGAVNPALYRAGLLHLVPPAHRSRASNILDTIMDNLRWWLAGQVFLMIAIGLTTALGLWLLGIPLALILGLIAGIFEIIPYLGAWLAAIPAALIAFLVGPWHVLMVLGFFLFVHLLEGYVLGPLVQRRAVHLPPAVTIVAQVLFGELLGILGIFVAAPLALTIIACLQKLYVEDALGDHGAAAG